jgi:hypothetical protein
MGIRLDWLNEYGVQSVIPYWAATVLSLAALSLWVNMNAMSRDCRESKVHVDRDGQGMARMQSRLVASP